MKKERMKGFVAGLLVAVLALGLIGTAAATIGKRTVEVDYTDIKIELNGKKVTPLDANGNAVEPFAINGTTYLPVRAVSNALGLDVGWDGATSTVKLNAKTPKTQVNADVLEAMRLYKRMEDTAEYGQMILDHLMTRMIGVLSGLDDEAKALKAINDFNDDISMLKERRDDFLNTKNILLDRKNLVDELTPASESIVGFIFGTEYLETTMEYAASFIRTNDIEDYDNFNTWYNMAFDQFRDAKSQSSKNFDVMYQRLADAIS